MKMVFAAAMLFLFSLSGCKPMTAEEYKEFKRQQMKADLEEIDRLQQDRFRYEAQQEKALYNMKLREEINRAKARGF